MFLTWALLPRKLLNVAEDPQQPWHIEHHDVHVGSDMLVLVALHQAPQLNKVAYPFVCPIKVETTTKLKSSHAIHDSCTNNYLSGICQSQWEKGSSLSWWCKVQQTPK